MSPAHAAPAPGDDEGSIADPLQNWKTADTGLQRIIFKVLLLKCSASNQMDALDWRGKLIKRTPTWKIDPNSAINFHTGSWLQFNLNALCG